MSELNNPSLKTKIIELANQIPVGKVVNYGKIGNILGVSGQLVGFMLSGMKESEWEELPWHRVVAKDGTISSAKLRFKGDLQKRLLESEGVVVQNNQVDMQKYNFDFGDLDSSELLF
jgi:methylated-DNA-protein-cysteine methyltransferase related protein